MDQTEENIQADTLYSPDYSNKGVKGYKGFNKRNIALVTLVLIIAGTAAVYLTSIKKPAPKPEDGAPKKNQAENLQPAHVDDMPGMSTIPVNYDEKGKPPAQPADGNSGATAAAGNPAPGSGQLNKAFPTRPADPYGQYPADAGGGGGYTVPAAHASAGEPGAPGPTMPPAQRAREARLKHAQEVAQKREEIQEKARNGGMGFGLKTLNSAASGDSNKGGATAGNELRMPQMSEVKLPQTAALGGAVGGENDPAKQNEKQKYLDKDRSKKEYRVLAQYRDPISPYQIMAGTLIPCMYVTGINSDLPGHITGQVSETVYDTVTGRYPLIPQGTKALGEYSNIITSDQERVLVIWTRLIFPNGRSINLEGMPGVDLSGYAGSRDKINRHFFSIASAAILSSLMGAGVNMAAGNNQAGNANFPQLAAGGAATRMQTAGDKILDRYLSRPPTLMIRPGNKFNILVNNDIILKPYRR